MAGENIVTINEQNFEQEVLQSTMPVLVDFWAEWCPPCVGFAPTLELFADEYKGRVKVGKINVEENPNLTLKFNIMGIPAFFIFKGGEITDRVSGAYKDKVREMIDRALLQTA